MHFFIIAEKYNAGFEERAPTRRGKASTAMHSRPGIESEVLGFCEVRVSSFSLFFIELNLAFFFLTMYFCFYGIAGSYFARFASGWWTLTE